MEPATILLLPVIALTSVRAVRTLFARIVVGASWIWARSVARALVPLMAVAALVGSSRDLALATTPPAGVRLVDVASPGLTSDPGASPSIIERPSAPWKPDHPMGTDGASVYEVERGDSLWRIARSWLEATGRSHDGAAVGRLWRAIYEANKAVIGDDPDLILPGQLLTIPEE